jgi:hypothetical protein
VFDIDPNIAPGNIVQIVLLSVDANDANAAKRQAQISFIKVHLLRNEELIATLTPLLRKE